MKNIIYLIFGVFAACFSSRLMAENDAQLKFGFNPLSWFPEVSVPASASLNTIGGTTSTNRAFTLEAWIKADPSSPAVPQILSKRTTINNGFIFGLTVGGRLYVRLNNVDVIDNINTSYPATAAYPTTTLKDGKYHHVAVSRSNAGKVKYYVDGVLVGTYTNTLSVALNCKLVIGRDPMVALFTNFKGLIDDVRIWNVERTGSQIAASRCNLAVPYPSELKAYWKCDDGTGSTILDATSNVNTGTFGGSGGTNPDWAVRNVFVLNNMTNIFEDNQILTEDVVFESFPNTAVWLNGATAGTNDCYDPNWYSQFNSSTNMRNMSFKLYRPNPAYDKSCVATYPSIIYVHGGGYANEVSVNALSGDDVCKELAKSGYVVIGINYRKGMDIGGANNLPNSGITEGYASCNASPNKTFSFIEATYRMVQDVKAAHARLLCGATAWKVNPNQVFYCGVSTGACAVLNAAYGADDMPSYREEPTSTTNFTTLGSKHGLPLAYAVCTPPAGTSVDNVAGVLAIAGAIHNLEWIGNRIDGKDKIPAYLAHGTLDKWVPFCAGNLRNVNFPNGIGSPTHLDLYGSGRIYDEIRSFSAPATFKAYLVNYDDADHDLQVVGNTCTVDTLARVWYAYFAMTIFSASNVNNISFDNTIINVASNLISCPLVTTFNTNGTSCCSTGGCLFGSYYTNKTAVFAPISAVSSLTLSPNPTTTHCQLAYNSTIDESVSLMVYDLSGKQLYAASEYANEGSNEYTIDTDQLPSGIYIVRLQTPTQGFTERLVINK